MTATPEIALSKVLRWMCYKSGLTDDQFEITGIDDVVNGAIIMQRVSFKDLMRDISVLYQIDIFESEGVIKFVRKARGEEFVIDRSIATAELAWIKGDSQDSDRQKYGSKQSPDARPPTKLEMRYLNPQADYTVDLVYAQRTSFPVQTAPAGITTTLAIPFAMDPSEALVRITKALYSLWVGQDTHLLRLLPGHMDLEPSDVLEVTVGSRAYILKIDESVVNGDYSNSLVGRLYAIDDNVSANGTSPIVVPVQSTTGLRITEEGDFRITEEGDSRIPEG